MRQAFKPRGLRIYRFQISGRSLDGGPRYALGARVRSKGRTGAAVRARFLAVNAVKQQAALEDWSRGRFTNALR